MKRIIVVLFSFLIIVNMFSLDSKKKTSISIMPIYDLSYKSADKEMKQILTNFTSDLKKNEKYNVIDAESTAEKLDNNNITYDSILLDDDLKEIIKIMKTDFLVYNVIFLKDKISISLYTKIIDSKGEITTIETALNEKSKRQTIFKEILNETIKKIDKEPVAVKKEEAKKVTLKKEDAKKNEEKKAESDKLLLKRNADKKSEKDKAVIKKDESAKFNFKFTTEKKAGVGLLASGGVLFTGGVTVLLVDCLYYFDVVNKQKENYLNGKSVYSQYYNAYCANIGMFAGSIIVGVLGTGLLTAGFILFFYEKKDTKVSLEVNISKNVEFAFCYRFD